MTISASHVAAAIADRLGPVVPYPFEVREGGPEH
jgi:hypothetical protein